MLSPLPLRFSHVSCTLVHVLAVTTEGALFSWGLGESGRLGNGSTKDCDGPQLVQALKAVPIASAEAGRNTSLALARNGDVWSWGEGLALGHGGGSQSQQLLPKVVDGLRGDAAVLRIGAGGFKAACVCADGSTLCWGKFHHETGASTPTPLV